MTAGGNHEPLKSIIGIFGEIFFQSFHLIQTLDLLLKLYFQFSIRKNLGLRAQAPVYYVRSFCNE